MRLQARLSARRRTAVPSRSGTRFANPTGAARATGGTGGTGPTGLAAAISLVVALGLVAALVPAVLLGLATPASAHSRLVTSTPVADSTLTAPPHEIILMFNEPVSPRYTNVAVTAADGASVTAGATRVEGGSVHQDLTALRDGRYTVAYRVVSEDGHPVGG
ncbi:copper resistance CopC family protein, partial [Frankia sp. CcWB3]